MNLKPEDITVVSVMPCLSKKYEASREEFAPDGIRDVDNVISTRELASMFKEAGIQLDKLEPQEYDNPLGESTGAAVIFRCVRRSARSCSCVLLLNGSQKKNLVMLTLLRSVVSKVSRKRLFQLRVLMLKSRFVQVWVMHARSLKRYRKAKLNTMLLKSWACPGGCLNGGGQPYARDNSDILDKRCEAIYKADEDLPIRKSHENPHIKKL